MSTFTVPYGKPEGSRKFIARCEVEDIGTVTLSMKCPTMDEVEAYIMHDFPGVKKVKEIYTLEEYIHSRKYQISLSTRRMWI